jgi:hypothetical protein
VKRPADLYPVEITVTLYDQNGTQRFDYTKNIIKAENAEKGDVLTLNFDKEFTTSCKRQNSPEHFCSFRIFTKPKWTVKEHQVGVYVYSSSLGSKL